MSWLNDVTDKRFVNDFQLFSCMQRESIIKHDLDPKDDYVFWLQQVKLMFINNNKDVSERDEILSSENDTILMMKYDGRYSGHSNFISTVVDAFKTNDPIVLLNIRITFMELYSHKDKIVDYYSLLQALHSSLVQDKLTTQFAALLKNYTLIGLDFLDICIKYGFMQLFKSTIQDAKVDVKLFKESTEPIQSPLDNYIAIQIINEVYKDTIINKMKVYTNFLTRIQRNKELACQILIYIKLFEKNCLDGTTEQLIKTISKIYYNYLRVLILY